MIIKILSDDGVISVVSPLSISIDSDDQYVFLVCEFGSNYADLHIRMPSVEVAKSIIEKIYEDGRCDLSVFKSHFHTIGFPCDLG